MKYPRLDKIPDGPILTNPRKRGRAKVHTYVHRKKNPAKLPLDTLTDKQAIKKALEYVKYDADYARRVIGMVDGVQAGDFVTSPEQAAGVIYPLVAGLGVEALVVMALDKRRRVIDAAVVSLGSAGFTIVDPAVIYRWALLQGRSGASGLIMAHNHPSGDPQPSSQDREVTRRVATVGRSLGIPLLDHLVVVDAGEARLRYTSLAERGELPSFPRSSTDFAT